MTSETEVVNLTDAAMQRLGDLRSHDPDGLITPEAFVEDATSWDSPLHRYLDWDESEAAHQWRLHQARLILGRIRIKEVRQERGYSNLTPALVSIRVKSVNGGVRR